MNKKAKQTKPKLSDRKSEFALPINWLIITIISLVFVLGILAEFVL